VFIRALDEPMSRILRAALAAADPDKAKKNWETLLRGKATEKRAVAAILDVASSAPEPIANIVAELRLRFPQASSKKTNAATN
jgi:hypothetical protein